MGCHNILLLFDAAEIQREAVVYAVELAGRMETGILLLLLLEIDFEVGKGSLEELAKRGELSIAPHVEFIQESSIEASGFVAVGDPASELLKFLARNYLLSLVVWGGGKLPASRPSRSGEHWLTRIQEKLGCPLVVPGF